MFKTIFGKQFAAYIGTLIIGFGLLGLILVNIFNSYFINQKRDEMKTQSNTFRHALTTYFVNNIFVFSNDKLMQDDLRETLGINLKTIYFYTGMSFFVVLEDKSAWWATPDIKNIESFTSLLDSDMIAPIYNSEKVEFMGTLNGAFNEKTMTIGYPVKMDEKVVAVVFINSSLADVEKTTADIIQYTLYCLLISALISCLLVYFTSKTISKPIYKMNEAAKYIAGGNFENKIVVKSKDEVGQLAESFNYMAESLNNQEIQRREFIGNISHDLRSPLTSMKGFLQAILDGTIPPEKHERYLHVVLDETERLSKLANDILDISKLQNLNIELNITRFDINELIRKTALMLETRVTEKQIEMNISFADDKTMVMADMEKIQRVVYNLLDNAIKFTENGGIIAIETKLAPENKKALVSVKDSGIGVSKEEQKKIFERFYKADSSRGEDKKGSGLGLSIVREFIKAHEESIDIISDTNKGCEFIFSLSYAENEEHKKDKTSENF